MTSSVVTLIHHFSGQDKTSSTLLLSSGTQGQRSPKGKIDYSLLWMVTVSGLDRSPPKLQYLSRDYTVSSLNLGSRWFYHSSTIIIYHEWYPLVRRFVECIKLSVVGTLYPCNEGDKISTTLTSCLSHHWPSSSVSVISVSSVSARWRDVSSGDTTVTGRRSPSRHPEYWCPHRPADRVDGQGGWRRSDTYTDRFLTLRRSLPRRKGSLFSLTCLPQSCFDGIGRKGSTSVVSN